MVANNPAIDIRELSKTFGSVRAVHELSLDVARGEIFGFLGPNGAGKTTTIRLLLDFIRPTSGGATVLGGCGSDPTIRRRIGYLPADLHLPGRYTGNEVFAFFGGLRGGVDRQRVDALLERFELDPTRPIAELSTGNRRKVGIVQAFMHTPELLVLDEPTSGLDPLLQQEFHQLLRESVHGGATVFLSSHVLPEVERIADRVAILRAGQLVMVSTVTDLRETARQILELHVAGELNVELFEGLAGVVEVTAGNGVIRVVVEGSVDPVIKAASAIEVKRIVSVDDDLEDVFLSLYRDGKST